MNTEILDDQIAKLEQDNKDTEKKMFLMKEQIEVNKRLIKEFKKGKERLLKAQGN